MHLDLVGRELEQRLGQRFLRTLHVGLDDDGYQLHLACGHVGEHVLQLGCLLLGQLGIAELASAVGGNFTGAALVCQHHELITCLWHLGQTLNFHRNRRTRRLDGLAVFVQHGAHTAVGLASQHHITSFQRAGLHQDGGNRAAALVQTRFNHQALGHGIDRGLEFQHLGLQQHLFEQLVDALTGLGGNRDEG